MLSARSRSTVCGPVASMQKVCIFPNSSTAWSVAISAEGVRGSSATNEPVGRVWRFFATWGLDVLVVSAAAASAIGTVLRDDPERPDGLRLLAEVAAVVVVLLAWQWFAKGPGAVTISPGDEGGAMTNGATHAGAIAVGDLDAWTFAAATGDAIMLSVGKATGSATFTPWIRLVAPNGVVVGNNWGASAGQVNVNASVTGTYTVIVGSGDAARAGTGTYHLTLAKAPGAFTVSAGDEGGAMTNGARSYCSLFST